MAKRWNGGDILRLTRDCELGKCGDHLVVLATEGDVMTVRREADVGLLLISEQRPMTTGRDYEYAVKVGFAPSTRLACEPAPSGMSGEDVGVIYGMLLVAQGALRDVAARLPGLIVGSPQDHARTELATALQATEMARYWVAKIGGERT